jgi:DNA-binding IclR family transcriptional regulator
MVSYVPPHRLIRIFECHHRDIAKAGLGTDWQGFRDNLAAIRRDGYCVSYGEINPGIFGVAASVFNADGLVVGSILIAGVAERLGARDVSNFGQVTLAAAKRLTDFLARDRNDLVHPPRAFGSTSARARR